MRAATSFVLFVRNWRAHVDHMAVPCGQGVLEFDGRLPCRSCWACDATLAGTGWSDPIDSAPILAGLGVRSACAPGQFDQELVAVRAAPQATTRPGSDPCGNANLTPVGRS